MLDTNVVGVIRMTQAVLPLLKRKNYADVVFIGSIAGRVAYKMVVVIVLQKLLFVVLSIHLEKKALILVLE